MPGRCLGQFRLDRLAALLEVPPALVVDRQSGPGPQLAAQGHRLGRRHRVAQGAGQREADATQVEERRTDGQPVGDLTYTAVQDGVPGDPQHAVPLPLPAQGEARHLADDRAGEGRPVPCRGRRDLDRRAARGRQAVRRPGGEAVRVAAEPARPGRCRQDDVHPGQQGSAPRVEVVAVAVVGEQHGIQRREFGSCQGRSRGLHRRGAPAEGVAAAGRVERRVREQPPAARLDQRGRTADVGDAGLGHTGFPPGFGCPGRPVTGRRGLSASYRACRTAHSRASSAISSQPGAAGSRCGRPAYSLISVTVFDL